MAILVYFSDDAGKELPYSGSLFASCGAYVNRNRNNDRHELEVRQGDKLTRLTCDDFGGQAVNVKVWAPRGSEYWRLVPNAGERA